MRVGLTTPVALAAAVAVAALWPAGPAGAAPAAPTPLNGRYQMVTYASQKAGTSAAARQREGDFGAVFTLSTACSGSRCLATVVDGPPPGNPSIPQPIRYTWNGSDWTSTYLYRTQLQGVDLSGVKGLTRDQVALACGDDDTRLPEGVARPERWPCNAQDD